MTELVQAYTHEAGVRNLEREIANIMRKVARTVAEGRKRKTVVDIKKLMEYLGPPRFEYGELEPEDQIGSATGLVVTEVGGDVVAIEVTRMDGKEDFILTGQLGEVMRESARAGLSWIRTHADGARHQPRDVREADPAHPRAGRRRPPRTVRRRAITMATAMVSAFTGIPVRKDVAMTGEITLRGRVLPIGGLKSKILAAHLSGAQDGRSSRARTRRTSGTSPRRSASRSRSSWPTRWTRSSRPRSGAGRSPSRPGQVGARLGRNATPDARPRTYPRRTSPRS